MWGDLELPIVTPSSSDRFPESEDVETETFTWFGVERTHSTTEINGRHYVVCIIPVGEGTNATARRKRAVSVYYADDAHGLPDDQHDLRTTYERVVRDIRWDHNCSDVESHVADALNEAVCQVAHREAEEQALHDRIEAAMEATAEVHSEDHTESLPE